jgi:hypothetical protein
MPSRYKAKKVSLDAFLQARTIPPINDQEEEVGSRAITRPEHVVKEPAPQLPQMDKLTFCARFKLPVQECLSRLRQFHHHQANSLKGHPIDDPGSHHKRVQFLADLWFREYRLQDMMTGFDPTSLDDLLSFIISERVASKYVDNGYHSRPQSLQRFCELRDQDGQQCQFRKWFDFCDMHHAEDTQDGDIVWVKNQSKYADPYDDDWRNETTLVMLHKIDAAEQHRFDTWSLANISTVQLSSLVCEFQKHPALDFLASRAHDLQNCDLNNPRELFSYQTSQHSLRERTSKFVCTLEQLSAFYEINFECFQLRVLAQLGTYKKNLLNCLLNGYLGLDVLYSLSHLTKFVEIRHNSVTPEVVTAWLAKHGPKRLWEFIKELVVEYDTATLQ